MSPLPTTPEQLFAALDALGIRHATVKHPPVFTVEQASRLRGQIAGGHTKNLFLRDKKHALYLVVTLKTPRSTSRACTGAWAPAGGFHSARPICWPKSGAWRPAR